MGRDDLGPIAQYNSLTDPYLQGYYSKSMIRHHLRQTGLISRKGDIVPEEVWRKRIATKEKMEQASRLIASKIVQQAIELKNLERAEIRRKLDEISKKELVKRIRGQSANRELPLLWPNYRGLSEDRNRTRSRSRSRSPKNEDVDLVDDDYYYERHRQYRRTGKKWNEKRLGSKKRLTKLNRGYAVLPKMEPTPVMVTMYYYGKSINIPFDTQVFEYRDEISIYQQHCGGENLLVYSGLHQAGDKFEFRSKRHKEYPFSLTIYINGTYDCRISTCCEYKHQLNVKIGGKGGRFAITNVTGSQPCIKCLLEKSDNETKKKQEKEQKRIQEENKIYEIEPKTEKPTTTNKSPQPQTAAQIEVRHSGDEVEENYDNEFNDSDKEEVEEVEEESKSSKSSNSSKSPKSNSYKENEIKKIEIPLKAHDEITSSESDRKSPEVKKTSKPSSANNFESNRYSSNAVMKKIENDAEKFKSDSTKKSTEDDTSNDQSDLDDSFSQQKPKTPSVRGSKPNSRADSRINDAKSPSIRAFSRNSNHLENETDKKMSSRVQSARSVSRGNTTDENDSDTEQLLSRINNGKKTPSQKGSKAASPANKPKSKTPSQKSSRNVSPAEKSKSKTPSQKSSRNVSPAEKLKSKSPSQKSSRAVSPAESAKSLKDSKSLSPNQKKLTQIEKEETSSEFDSSSESQNEKNTVTKGSTPTSPVKIPSKSASPEREITNSRKSSAKSKKNSESESESEKEETVLKALILGSKSGTQTKTPSPTKSLSRPQTKSPVEKPNYSLVSTSDTSSISDSTSDSANAKGEIKHLKTKNSQNLDEENTNTKLDTNPRNISSPPKSNNSRSAHQSPLPDVQKSFNGSRKSLKHESNSEDESEKSIQRASSSAKKEEERTASSASKKNNRSPSVKDEERPGSSVSKKSSRPSSKNEKNDLPKVNVIPSSDAEKNSSTSINDDSKWYKDEDERLN